MSNIVVIGGGFAGLWAALGAQRKLDELGVGPEDVAVTLINRDAWHAIRVRNYEPDLSDVRVPLDEVLGPVGVVRIEGEVVGIDIAGRRVEVDAAGGRRAVPYDRLVFAAGSRLCRPAIPGLAEHAFSIDTYDEAARLDRHIATLPDRAAGSTAIVVGAGLTGIEAACELPDRLRAAGAAQPRVILADALPHVGSDMGEHARPVIEEALATLGIETRTGIAVAAIDADGLTLATGERIAAATVLWTAGLEASPLTALFPVPRDRSGRIAVDEYLRVEGVDGVFAAGDVAALPLDPSHHTLMSCQHGRPMGRFAGHNVVCDLMGADMLALTIGYYVTCLDLGPWGALYTNGWDREVVATGAAAKTTKRTINTERIYPPRSGDRREILEAAAPVLPAAAGADLTRTPMHEEIKDKTIG